jgi:aspartyl-tRNA(Asn)/glutamyl-tRNA(Gln) amidotransferase subunit B
VNWQIDQIEDGRKIQQATVLFNPDTGETRAMRSKEDAADYRYFPDPDLPPLVIAPEWVERVKGEMPELPRAMAARFERRRPAGLRRDDDDPEPGHGATTRPPRPRPAQAGGQLADGRGLKRLNARRRDRGRAGQPRLLAQLIGASGRHHLQQRRQAGVRRAVDGEASEVDAVIEAKGLKQMNDTGALEKIIDEVIAANPSRSRAAPARTRPSTPWSAR